MSLEEVLRGVNYSVLNGDINININDIKERIII